MYGMFQNAKSFNQDISNWNLNKVKDIDNMFYKCNINDIYKPNLINKI